VCCGDWSRVVTESVTVHVGTPTGIVLDPPYLDGESVYSDNDRQAAVDARDWAVQHGADRALRIVYCGYEGTVEFPPSWRVVPWKAKGGYGNTRKDGVNENSRRERLYLSPHCLDVTPAQRSFWDGAT
jgi:hypothetical protein